MKNLTTLFMTLVICSSAAVVASEESEEKTIDQMLASLKMEKIQAEIMIEAMAKRGKFNDEEVSRAKREIASVKEEDIQEIQAEAIERLSSKNSYATK